MLIIFRFKKKPDIIQLYKSKIAKFDDLNIWHLEREGVKFFYLTMNKNLYGKERIQEQEYKMIKKDLSEIGEIIDELDMKDINSLLSPSSLSLFEHDGA